jgi:hypothetical protein
MSLGERLDQPSQKQPQDTGKDKRGVGKAPEGLKKVDIHKDVWFAFHLIKVYNFFILFTFAG